MIEALNWQTLWGSPPAEAGLQTPIGLWGKTLPTGRQAISVCRDGFMCVRETL